MRIKPRNFILTILLSLVLTGATLISEETCELGIKEVVSVITMDFYQFQIEQMMLAYVSKDPMTGIAIIEKGIEWISVLKKQESDGVFEGGSLSKDIAIFNVRLGNLHRKLGHEVEYDSYLTNALTLYNSTCDGSTCKKITRERMVWLVSKMDNP